MKSLTVLFFALILCPVVCGAGGGDRFIGTWSEVGDDTPTTVRIERNNGIFILRVNYGAGRWGFKKKPASFPAEFEGGMLNMKTGRGEVPLAIDTGTENLIVSGVQLKIFE